MPNPANQHDAGSVADTACALIYANMDEVVYRLAVEAAGRYRCVFVNPAWEKMTGLAVADVIGKLVSEVIPEPSCSLVLAHLAEAIRSGATQRWEETTDFPLGRRIGAVTVTPVLERDGRCTDLIGTVHDITELKQREQQLSDANAELQRALAAHDRLADELRLSEQRLQIALEGTGQGVWDWNLDNGQMFCTPQGKQIIGLDAEAPISQSLWLERVHPDDLAPLLERVRAFLASDEPVLTLEYRLRHQQEQWIWVRVRGSVAARTAAGAPQRMVGTIIDITETVRLRQQVERSHELLSKLSQQVPGALFEMLLDPAGQLRCSYVSAMATELFELTPEQITADCACLIERIAPRERARMRRALRRSAATLQPWRTEFEVRLPRQGQGWREINAKPTRLRDGSIVWHGFTDDISERKRTEQTIRDFHDTLARRAHYDTLTSLPNRELFRDRLDVAIARAQAERRGVALLFIDLDRFKQVNDLLGHDVGDAVLVQAARRIEQCLRAGDTVARLGGDEFVVVLVDAGEVAHVELTAQQILDTLAAPFHVGEEQAYVSASIGIALYPADATLAETLMRNADQAMYRAKAGGRNQLSFFEQSMQAAAMQRLKVTNALRRAVPEHQLRLYFQPIVELDGGAIVKAEALLRWQRPGEQLALPGEFIDIAEETGLIHEIGDWVFSEAARWSKRWSAMLGRPFQISINKSPIQFQADRYAAQWIAHLRQIELAPAAISIEITEGVLLDLSSTVLSQLHQLRAGGIEVAIDDFGTGYSSMSYLKQLDIDYLKVDQSFIGAMLNDSTSRTIAETIIIMAHKLGLKVVAEGVETAAQRDWLAQQHCDYAQGYWFAPAVGPRAFEVLLAPHAAGGPAAQ